MMISLVVSGDGTIQSLQSLQVPHGPCIDRRVPFYGPTTQPTYPATFADCLCIHSSNNPFPYNARREGIPRDSPASERSSVTCEAFNNNVPGSDSGSGSLSR